MSDDRIGFIERLGRLAGQTTYRQPIEGVGTRSDYMPESHVLAARLSYARGSRWNPGPELAYTIATGIPCKRDEVIDWLASKMALSMEVSTQREGILRGIAVVSYCILVHPEKMKNVKLSRHVMRIAEIGAAWLSACLDNTISLAELQVTWNESQARETA